MSEDDDLARVNAAGLEALRRYLDGGEAVAFLGAGVSAPLYPLWTAVIADLVEVACARGLGETAATTIRTVAAQRPDAVVELVRQHLGAQRYQAALREVFRVRHDEESGRTWTLTHELLCRCPFKGVVTTNYDPGIIDARMRVRPRASGTGFTSWTDELNLDRWDTEDVFGDDELPVLFAHGHHNQPDAIVLAATEYRRAYAGKLSRVLAGLVRRAHLVWIGFSFADQRIAAVLREVAEQTGTAIDPGGAPRHVAVMGWDPDGGMDPETLRAMAAIEYGAELVLYRAPNGDHSALQTLLSEFTAPTLPPAAVLPKPPVRHDAVATPVMWTPPAEPVPNFTGRTEELARLSRWAADPSVRLIGVTAWGGAGKTALITEWFERHGGAVARPEVRGLFGWSFYADASAEHWAQALLEWASEKLGFVVTTYGRPGAVVLDLLRSVPLVLVLDGLEVSQEGPAGAEFGRLLDGILREVLTGVCQIQNRGLVVLTSRFPFADLERFDGDAARMLEVPPFTPAEGASLLAAAGGGWLAEEERRDLVTQVDGHALAVAALGAALADRPPTADLVSLRAGLAAAASTNARIAKVLRFYATRLSKADQYLVAVVALFARPVTPEGLLAVAGHEAFGGHLDGWNSGLVEAAARFRLAGLLSWHPNGTLAAHPLVRDTFRPLALDAAEIAADVTLTDLPAGTITSREDGRLVVEAIELLIAADQWQAADDLYQNRTRTATSSVWLQLPAAGLGQRASSAFVATDDHRSACTGHLGETRLAFYLGAAGLYTFNSGDPVTAVEYQEAGIEIDQEVGDATGQVVSWGNLSEFLGSVGGVQAALEAAEEATAIAVSTGNPSAIYDAAACQARALTLLGDSIGAEEQFMFADRIAYGNDNYNDSDHLVSIRGVWWAELLARTGRTGAARILTDGNRKVCVRYDWNDDTARCDRMLARLDLATDARAAQEKVAAVVIVFRDGDLLVELADTLPLLAECARTVGDLDAADLHIAEALTLARPRQLVPAQAAALTVRAHIHADRAAAGDLIHVDRGRDDADTALRLAVRHRLAWHELDALDAHARLDTIARSTNNWADRAAALRSRLIPAGLDPDPLGTVERQVAAERANTDEPDI